MRKFNRENRKMWKEMLDIFLIHNLLDFNWNKQTAACLVTSAHFLCLIQMFPGICHRDPTTAIKGQRWPIEWCGLPKEAKGFVDWDAIPSGLFPLLGATAIIPIPGIKLHQTLIALVGTFWLTSLSCPIERGPHCFSSLLFSFSTSCPVPTPPPRLHCQQKPLTLKMPSIYHVRGTPYILSSDSENVHSPSLESSQYEWKRKSVYTVLWEVGAFLACGREIRVHGNHPPCPLLETLWYFATEIKNKITFIKWDFRV